jgi:signal transduction histidine kinase
MNLRNFAVPKTQGSTTGLFRLTYFFSITSLVAFIAVTIVLGLFFRDTAVKDLIAMGERNNVGLTQAFANSLWPAFESFVASAGNIPADQLAGQPEITALHEAVVNHTRGLSVIKIKVYDLNGLTVFSSQASQIGEDKRGNAGFQAARAGNVATELTHRDTFSTFEGTIENRDVISSYIPIQVDGQIEAVFEVYDDVTPLLEQINATQTTVLLVVVGVLAALYIVLFLIVRYADHLIRQHMAERRQAEAQLAGARDQALAASRLKSQILSNISHDARTPLNVIMARVEMLQMGLYGVLSEKQNEVIGAINAQAVSLLEFIKNLLDQAQMEAGQLKLNEVAFETDMLADYVASLRPLTQAKGLKLTCETSPDLPPTLLGDPERLKQILSNLVGNAIKFTQEGGITVCFRRADSAHWALDVSDTGPGIPVQEQKHLFEAFWQGDGSLTRENGRGVGLGLSIVQQLTTAMNGQIQVKSEMGKGSTFTVTLPLITEMIRNTA